MSKEINGCRIEEGKTVVHHPNKYGDGVVTMITDKYIYVRFDIGSRTFLWPSAFEKGFLEIGGELQQRFAVVKKIRNARDVLSARYKLTSDWVYSIYDYFPSAYRNCDVLDLGLAVYDSDAILRYKDGNHDAVNFGTSAFMIAIQDIVVACNLDCDVWLMSVPSSKIYKTSSVVRSIHDMLDALNDHSDESWSIIPPTITVYDKTKCLTRVVNIESAHLSVDRPDIDTHLASIKCQVGCVPTCVLVFLLDDVVTTGTTLLACRKLLVDAGVPEEFVLGLTLGKTFDRLDYVDYLKVK